MANNKLKTAVVAVTAVTSFFITSTSTAHALKSDWKTGHWVTLTKDVPVYKMRNMVPMSNSYKMATYTAPRGSHYKLEHWGVDYSWVLQSGKFNSNSYYTYVVGASYKGGWFKAGIYNLPKYKAFHGYRIEGSKTLYSYNTFYDKDIHCVLSDYRPTQYSKVIFQYGSHVVPTSHTWTWFHGSKGHLLTDYRYKNGSWHRYGKTYNSDTDKDI